jgi:hypothetical protein
MAEKVGDKHELSDAVMKVFDITSNDKLESVFDE